jgi:hypothetical protein
VKGILSTPKRKLFAAVVAAVMVYYAFPYFRCWSLASVADRTNSGAMGCGRATIQLHTSAGVIPIENAMDGYHVFGRDIYVSCLVSLLHDRAAANRRGFGPMAGDKGSLCYVALDLLGSSGDPAAIAAAGPLLTDADDAVRGWAAIALYRLGDEHPEFRPAISQYRFPRMAIVSASSRLEGPRPWIDAPKER